MLKSESKTPSELKKAVQINEDLTVHDLSTDSAKKVRMSESKRRKSNLFDPETKGPSNYRPCLK